MSSNRFSFSGMAGAVTVGGCSQPSPKPGGRSFFEAPPRLRNARVTPFNEKSGKPFRGAFSRL